MLQGLYLLLMVGETSLPAVHCLVLVALRIFVNARGFHVQLGLQGQQVFPLLPIHVHVLIEAGKSVAALFPPQHGFEVHQFVSIEGPVLYAGHGLLHFLISHSLFDSSYEFF